LKIDSADRYAPALLENPADSLKEFYYIARANNNFPNISNSFFANGQVIYSNIDKKHFSYFPSGRIKKESEVIEEGKKTIITDYNWFSNGQMASIKTTEKMNLEVVEKTVAVWDTLGKQIVKDGNGWDEHYEYTDDYMLIHSGLIKNGFVDGIWTGRNRKGEVQYREIYEKGKCIKGVSYWGKDSIAYENPQEPAEFKGGMQGFGRFLQGILKYPAAAQHSNVSGKVYLQFVVCTDGTLCDYKVLKSVGFGCDEESIRVLQESSGRWKPGKQRGKNIRTKFTIPINYLLSQ
jgi:TonB family protein